MILNSFPCVCSRRTTLTGAVSVMLIVMWLLTSFAAFEESQPVSSDESLKSGEAQPSVSGSKVFEAISAYLDGIHGKGMPPAKKRPLPPNDQSRKRPSVSGESEANAEALAHELRTEKNLTLKRIQEGDWALAASSLERSKKAASRLSSARESEHLQRLEKFMDSKARRAATKEGQFGIVVNSIGMKMVVLPGGTFTMGSSDAEFRRIRIDWNVEEDMVRPETPSHTVVISKPYLIGKYAVTVGEFKRFVNETGYQTVAEKQGWAWVYDNEKKHWERLSGVSWKDTPWRSGDDFPVTLVCHSDAEAFCNWLSKREGRKYGLPTEAQWEFAARGGQEQKRYPWGDEYPDGRRLNIADRRAPVPWADQTVDDGAERPAPVGSYSPNAFGLYDIVGNLWHLCADYYDPRIYRNNADRPSGTAYREKKSRSRRELGFWSRYCEECVSFRYRTSALYGLVRF